MGSSIPSRSERLQKLAIKQSEPVELEFSKFNLDAFFANKRRSSETRFDELKDRQYAVTLIRKAAQQFAHDAGIEIRAIANSKEMPALSPNTHFKYSHGKVGEYTEYKRRLDHDEPVVVFIGIEGTVVVAYSLVEPNFQDAGLQIAIIDIERASRRSAGLRTTVTIEGQEFDIGVAHSLVDAILSHFSVLLTTDATSDASRYIFKSNGFANYDSSNICLLRHSPLHLNGS